MKLTMNVYLDELEEVTNRTIQVNDNISLKAFTEYLIIILNGTPKKTYSIYIKDNQYLSLDQKITSKEEKNIDDTPLKNFNLSKNDKITLYYGLNHYWEFYIKITSIENNSPKKDFELISGNGLGILDEWSDHTFVIFHLNPPEEALKRKGFREIHDKFLSYNYKDFNRDIFNEKLVNYIQTLEERLIPKNYILNVCLEYLGKVINRKISVNSNVSLDKLCQAIITSMQGDLFHAYTLKISNDFLEKIEIERFNLSYLDLKEGKIFRIIYDYGDDWRFKITTKQINIGYKEKNIEILLGKGYGIIEDCGGIGVLEEIFNGTSPYCDYYEYPNINDFNLEENNKMIEKFNN